MPTPKPNQTQEEFISNCITILIDEGYDNEQATAICQTKWEAASKNELREWTADNIGEGAFAMGFVNSPAIETDFIYLSKQENVQLKLDEEKRLVIGPALIPHKMIFRRNGKEKYYSYFTSETIKKIAHNFLGNNYNNNVSYDHLEVIKDGVTLAESWLVENETDKINSVYGYQLPKGTWCLAYHVTDDELWNDIKEGKLNGFSIESVLTEIELSDENEEMELQMLQSLIDLLKSEQINLNIPEIISFEVDGVLSNKKYQDIAKEYMGNTYRVVIVTSREDKDMEPVFEYGRQLGIDKEDIFNTNGADKLPVLERIGVTKHYDNNVFVIDELMKTPIEGVLAD